MLSLLGSTIDLQSLHIDKLGVARDDNLVTDIDTRHNFDLAIATMSNLYLPALGRFAVFGDDENPCAAGIIDIGTHRQNFGGRWITERNGGV